MKNGDVQQFIEILHYQDAIVVYEGKTFFFNGCCYYQDDNNKDVFTFDIYILDADGSGDPYYNVLG